MSPVKVPLTLSQTLAWADDHHRRTGRWPHGGSGPVQANPAETWGAIDQALAAGGRGLPGGDSLSRLLARERGREEARGRRPTQGGDHIRLLHSPYRRPSVRVGNRATCLIRGEVAVTSRTHARLRWPRCLPVNGVGHPSLLVDEELARAVRSESAAALCHWWGVSEGVVWRWRKALGVTRTSNPGSNRLVRSAAQAGAAAMREREWTEEEREQKRRLAIEGNYGAFFPPGCKTAPAWTAEELALLGTAPDAEVAKRIGKSRDAVRAQRGRLNIAPAGKCGNISRRSPQTG
jgi:hypothetical protein